VLTCECVDYPTGWAARDKAKSEQQSQARLPSECPKRLPAACIALMAADHASRLAEHASRLIQRPMPWDTPVSARPTVGGVLCSLLGSASASASACSRGRPVQTANALRSDSARGAGESEPAEPSCRAAQEQQLELSEPAAAHRAASASACDHPSGRCVRFARCCDPCASSEARGVFAPHGRQHGHTLRVHMRRRYAKCGLSSVRMACGPRKG
jgi:hypothetical protein